MNNAKMKQEQVYLEPFIAVFLAEISVLEEFLGKNMFQVVCNQTGLLLMKADKEWNEENPNGSTSMYRTQSIAQHSCDRILSKAKNWLWKKWNTCDMEHARVKNIPDNEKPTQQQIYSDITN